MPDKTVGQHLASAAVSTAGQQPPSLKACIQNFPPPSNRPHRADIVIGYPRRSSSHSCSIRPKKGRSRLGLGSSVGTRKPRRQLPRTPAKRRPPPIRMLEQSSAREPGQPGLNLNNPFAGIPYLGGEFQSLLPGNSNSTTSSTPPATPGQATINPFAQFIAPYLKAWGINNQ